MRTRTLTAALALLLLAAVVAGSSVSAQTGSPTIDPRHIPIGDLQTTATPSRGMLYSCQQRFPKPSGGSRPWIHSDGTWDATAKPRVGGSVAWKNVTYGVKVRGRTRTLVELVQVQQFAELLPKRAIIAGDMELPKHLR